MLVFALLLLGVNHGSALDDVNEGITYEELALMNRELVVMNRELMQTIKATDQRMSMMERKMEQLEGADVAGHDAIPKVSTNTHVSRFVVDSNDERVAFLARLFDPYSIPYVQLSSSNMIFDKALTNIGNHYNDTSGIFTAPRSGLYLFSATILSKVDAEIRATIKVNNTTKVVSIFAHGSEGERDAGSQVALLHLDQGDTVAVFNDTVIENPPWTNLPFNSFTGVMLLAY